ncbi:MAG: hypothetical protein ISS45_10445, partial [Candidatus Omnitrophica bacterium]|nr:hypothetical protein [Candidatus Omnitrophota bacterium]
AVPGRETEKKPFVDKLRTEEKGPKKFLAAIKNKIFNRQKVMQQKGIDKGIKISFGLFKNRKFMVFFACALALLLSLFIFQSVSGLAKEKKFRKMLNEQVSGLLTKQKELQNKLDEKIKEIEELKGTGKIGAMFGKSSEALGEYRETSPKLEQERQKLAMELEKNKSVTKELAQNLARVQENKMELEKKISNLERERDIWQVWLKGKGINIGIARMVKKELEAKVLVFEKKNQLVVIDVGELEGVSPGTEFDVYKQDELYARIKIDQVYETVSVGKIVPGVGIGRIEEGMRVKRR